MKKTLKTLINTSLLMLFVSHSYGKVYNLPDVTHIGNTPQPGYASSTSNQTTLLDANTHPEFNGVGDTFDGILTFEFTLTFDSYPADNNTNFAFIEFKNTQISDISNGTSRITIGNFWSSDVWDANIPTSDPFNFGNNQVVVGQSQSFTMTIYYRDGIESGTLSTSGDPTIYSLPWNYYSFDRIDFSSGFEGTNVSATNISLSIIPEPATYALIFGALAFGFVAVRRRFKA